MRAALMSAPSKAVCLSVLRKLPDLRCEAAKATPSPVMIPLILLRLCENHCVTIITHRIHRFLPVDSMLKHNFHRAFHHRFPATLNMLHTPHPIFCQTAIPYSLFQRDQPVFF